MPGTEHLRVAWFRRMAAVDGRAPRLALWAEAAAELPPDEIARRIEAATRAAALRTPGSTGPYLALLDLPELGRRAGPGVLARVLHAARDLELEAALLVLEHPGRTTPPPAENLPPDPILDTLPLGRRKTLARGPRTPLLDRLRADPDPRVVREVLRNPRLRETEVLAVASRRPAREETAWLLVRTGGWLNRPAVQRALVWNPWTPARLAVGLAVLLPDPELERIAREKGLHPAVREGALEVLAWRRG